MKEFSEKVPVAEEALLPAMMTICGEHLGLARGEHLLLVADPPKRRLAGEMTDAARELGFSAGLLRIGPIEKTGCAPPEFTTKALTMCAAALLVTSRSLSHTEQRRAACHEKGVRIASMPGLSPEMLCRLFKPGKPKEVAERTLALAARLEDVCRIRVRNRQGTDFDLELTGRKIYTDTGLYHHPGSFGNLPAGEVCAAPAASTLEGRAVVDVAFAGLGAVQSLILELHQGRLKNARGTDAQRLLSLLDKPEFRVVGEFGIGTNPLARPCEITLEAEKAIGTVHLGFGDNRSFGGDNAAAGHWDAVLRCDSLELDGSRLDLLP